MGRVTGTCGHELDTHWFMMGYCDVRVASTVDGVRIVESKEVCPECKKKCVILETKEAEEKWIKGE